MAGSIKLFQFNQKHYKAIGIYPTQPNQKHSSFNLTNSIYLFCFVQFCISMTAFIWFEANNMLDYAIASFGLVTTIIIMAIYLLTIWQKENTVKFIENCEEFIEKSKNNSRTSRIFSHILHYNILELLFFLIGPKANIAYQESIEIFEKLSEWFCYALICTLVTICIPPMIYTYVNYFISDLGNESYFLFFPAWFVYFNFN